MQRRITLQPPASGPGFTGPPLESQVQIKREGATPGWVSNNFNSGGSAYPSQRQVYLPASPNQSSPIAASKLETSIQSNEVQPRIIYSQNRILRPAADNFFDEVLQFQRTTPINVYQTPMIKTQSVNPSLPPQQSNAPFKEPSERNSLVREVYNPLKVNVSNRIISVESGQRLVLPAQPSVAPNEQAFAALRNQMDILFKEREAVNSENQRLKIANQGLLKDTEFLKTERTKLEEQVASQSAEKDTVYQRRIAELNKTMSTLYQQNKVLSEKAETSTQASQANRDLNFELENANYKLKNQVESMGRKLEVLELESNVLRKADAESKSKIVEMKNLLLEADERIYTLEKNGGEAAQAQAQAQQMHEKARKAERQLADERMNAESANRNLARLSEELFTREKHLQEKEIEFERLLRALEEQEKVSGSLRADQERLAGSSVPVSTHNMLRMTLEATQKDLIGTKQRLDEAQKSEDFLRQTLNELRRKHTQELTLSQKTNQDTHLEYQAQIDRLKEALHTAEEGAQTARVELEHTELTIKNLKNERGKFAVERATLESRAGAAERKSAGFEAELTLTKKSLAEAKEAHDLETKFKSTEGKKLAELKAENMAFKKEVMDLKAKLIVAAAKNQTETNRAQKALANASLMSIGDNSFNEGDGALRESRRKIRQLQNDYVELQNENQKLRDDVFRLREEKMENLDRSLQASKLGNSRRPTEGPDKAKNSANVLENAADILNGSFLKSPVRMATDINSESLLLDKDSPAKTLEEVKRLLQTAVTKWEEKFGAGKLIREMSLKQLAKRIEEIVNECVDKNEEFRTMNTAIEEANMMIVRLEYQKKTLLEELKEARSASSYASELR